ncbi:MAG TPA: DUF3105 domain-containing protein [Candidatus Binatia bacterium]|nr:DUF3105 domain-containing protein [Candidatus Binatia bacterium]
MTTSQRRPAPTSTARPPRRPRRATPRTESFLERNRSRLLWVVGGLVVVLLVGVAYLGFTRPTYACVNIFEPTPAPSFVAPTADPNATPLPSGATPEPAVTPPPPGYAQPDMGHQHEVDFSKTIQYRYCPPASGRHYNVTNRGPIRGGLYGPEDPGAVPPGWVHNLEHGAIVLLYKCPGPGCEPAGQAQLRELLERWPNSPICNIPPGEVTPVIARFDDMASNFTALVWDVVLPMDELDEALLFDFYARQAERFNPEKLCAAPTPTPGPATPTPSPAASPSSSQATSPGASPAASPAGSPAATTGPSPS